MMTDIDIMSKGIACLIRELGIVETETFIAYHQFPSFQRINGRISMAKEKKKYFL